MSALHNTTYRRAEDAFSHIPGVDDLMHQKEYDTVKEIALTILESTNSAIKGLQEPPTKLNRYILSKGTLFLLEGLTLINGALSIYMSSASNDSSVHTLSSTIVNECFHDNISEENCVSSRINAALPLGEQSTSIASAVAIFSVAIAIITLLKERASKAQDLPTFKENFLKEMILFKKFLEDFVDFGKKKDDVALKQCVSSYNNLSANAQKGKETNRLGAKEKWICAMIHSLPENSTLRRTYLDTVQQGSPMMPSQPQLKLQPSVSTNDMVNEQLLAKQESPIHKVFSAVIPQSAVTPLSAKKPLTHSDGEGAGSPDSSDGSVTPPKFGKWIELENLLGTTLDFLPISHDAILMPSGEVLK